MSLDLDFYSFVYVMITRQQSVRSTNQNKDGFRRKPISALEIDHMTHTSQLLTQYLSLHLSSTLNFNFIQISENIF